jgi:hypothetical protein
MKIYNIDTTKQETVTKEKDIFSNDNKNKKDLFKEFKF